MTIAVMSLVLAAAITLEISAPSSAYIGFAKPPFVMGVVAYCALRHSIPLMLAVAALGGILLDSVCAMPVGITSLALGAVGAALCHYRDTVFSGKLVTGLVFGIALGLSVPLMISILLLLFGREYYSFQPRILFLKCVGTAFYGSFLFPAIFAFLERLEKVTGTCGSDQAHNDNYSNN